MSNEELTRRDFVGMTVAAGLAAAAGADVNAQQVVVVEQNVEIKTPDGTCDSAFIHPANGAHPAVIIWPDAFGLRPSMRDMAKRLAIAGYSVLVPNPFYRVAKSPVYEDASKVDFQTERPKITPLMGSIQADGTVERDAPALVAWLDTQKEVDRNKKIGTQGYCMGGGLVTDRSNSPHLLAPKIKGRMYFGIATNDDMQQPDAKTKLKEAFDAAKVPAEIEVYSMAQHGWCVPDMPAGANGPIYNKADAERAWAKLEALYKTALV